MTIAILKVKNICTRFQKNQQSHRFKRRRRFKQRPPLLHRPKEQQGVAHQPRHRQTQGRRQPQWPQRHRHERRPIAPAHHVGPHWQSSDAAVTGRRRGCSHAARGLHAQVARAAVHG